MPEGPPIDPEDAPGRGSNDPLSLRPGVTHDPGKNLPAAVWLHRRLVSAVVGAMLAACLLYCIVAPRQYEARARVALPTTIPSSGLSGDIREKSGSFASGQTQLETLASVLRGDHLAWQVICGHRLYQAQGFASDFPQRFPAFREDHPDAGAEAYLTERFTAHLRVVTIPRTLVLEVRFQSRDPVLSALVVNSLIQAYRQEVSAQGQMAAREENARARVQLQMLRAELDRDEAQIAVFQKKHRLLVSLSANGHDDGGADAHLPALIQIDQLTRELAALDAERALRQAEEQASRDGDPETVVALDPRGAETSGLTASFRSLRERRQQLEQELAQLSVEHGPNFPRVVEVRRTLETLDAQLSEQSGRLREKLHMARQASDEHARLLRENLEAQIADGLRVDQAVASYAAMRREADATRDLYLRMQARVAEAEITSGPAGADIWVVDEARPPVKPASPNLPLALAITLFCALWIGTGSALAAERLLLSRKTQAAAAFILACATFSAGAQAPTPSTSGLPTGVARIPQSIDTRQKPDAKEAPDVWNGSAPVVTSSGVPPSVKSAPPALPIGPGDVLEISEFHTPEFHTIARVSQDGSVKLPLVEEVRIAGMTEQAAAAAIADKLLARGMLNHPQVFVLVTSYAGQDVTVLGEVARPGVYAYGVHHHLLDLLSSASGLTAYAGNLVNIYHREDPATPHSVVLDPEGTDPAVEHNPELAPGDIVQVRRAGLVYVVGDVIRPGGFVLDPSHELTVLKALSLAWGPTANAALGRAMLIHEQASGRTVTTLNLKRMLHGKDPDEPVHAHDILFVPNSTAKNLFNRSVESAIQSAAGVSIYAGMVYSQRF